MLLIIFAATAWLIIGYVLFQYPQPGIADQGDFDRVMNVSGLTLAAQDINDPHFVRFLYYTITDYQINSVNVYEIWNRLKATSMAYLITIISLICKAFNLSIFKTGYLAIVYAALYTLALCLIIKYFAYEKTTNQLILMVPAMLVLLDGNYLIWFNSLYGEPMMITTLLLYIAAWIVYIFCRYENPGAKRLFPSLLFICMTALLFLGSKLQVIFTLPVIFLMMVGLIRENINQLKPYQTIIMCLFLGIIILYPSGINRVYRDISKDTQYNSVFFGILKDSDNPAMDLQEMGLNPNLAVEAGKHAFLDKAEYTIYIPHTQLTTTEFYNHISNGQLVYFYLTHPARFYTGMEYTASQAFYTSTTLGKYPRAYSETPVSKFSRFTWWSSFREKQLPRSLWFLLAALAAVTAVSIVSYSRNKNNLAHRARIRLLWGVLWIGLIQFPMPLVGNGHADTAKQLYLFNFIFDLLLVTSVCWCLNFFLQFCQSLFSQNRLPIYYLLKLNSSSDNI